MSLFKNLFRPEYKVEMIDKDFDDYFIKLKNILREKTNNKFFDFELLGYLYTITIIASYQKKNQEELVGRMSNLIEDKFSLYLSKMDVISKRPKLYINIFWGEDSPRGEWTLGNVEGSPIVKTFIAFGDI